MSGLANDKSGVRPTHPELTAFEHEQLSEFREMMASFADEPYRQTEYKIIDFVLSWIGKTRIDELHRAFDLGHITLSYWQERMRELTEATDLPGEHNTMAVRDD